MTIRSSLQHRKNWKLLGHKTFWLETTWVKKCPLDILNAPILVDEQGIHESNRQMMANIKDLQPFDSIEQFDTSMLSLSPLESPWIVF